MDFHWLCELENEKFILEIQLGKFQVFQKLWRAPQGKLQ